MKKKPIQYTIRHVPEHTNQRLRKTAEEYGTSINQAALLALHQGLGLSAETVRHHDLDDLIGSWVQDKECDKALAAMDRADPELWK